MLIRGLCIRRGCRIAGACTTLSNAFGTHPTSFIEIKDETGSNRTITSVFTEAASKWPRAPFLVAPRSASNPVLEISYKECYLVRHMQS